MFQTYNDYLYNEDGTMEDASKPDATILGLPYDGGTEYVGNRLAPTAIRAASFWPHNEMVARDGTVATSRVVDMGDVDYVVNAWGDAHRLASDEATAAATQAAKHLTIFLGGDNSVSYYGAQALSWSLPNAPSIHVVSFDAHTDLWEQYPRNHATWVRDIIEDNVAKSVDIYGARCLEPDRSEFDSVVRIHDMDDVVTVPTEPFYLALDIDAVDPAFAPGTNNPEPGGYTSREFLSHVRALVSSPFCRAMDITEVSPTRDVAGITSLLASRVVAEALLGVSRRVA